MTAPDTVFLDRDGTLNVKAKEAPGLNYVTPGDPEHSWLMKKIEGVQACTDVACTKIPEAPSPCGDRPTT